MMKSIMPDVLEGKCKRFFKPVYHELADFDVEKEELEKSGAFWCLQFLKQHWKEKIGHLSDFYNL